MKFLYKHKVFLSSLFPLFCLLFAEWGKIYFLDEIKIFQKYGNYLRYTINISIIVYPILGQLSDTWCRKKVLFISLVFLILSILCLHIKLPILAVCFFASSPLSAISRAAYCDVHITNGKSPNIVNTFIVQAVPWIIFPFIFYASSRFFYLSGILLIIFVLLLFKDQRDKDIKRFHFGLSEALKTYGTRTSLIIILAFLSANIGWSILFYYIEKNQSISMLCKSFLLSPGLAFFLGAVFARLFIRKKRLLFFYFKATKHPSLKTDNYFKLLITLSLGVMPFLITISLLSCILSKSQIDIVFMMFPEITLFGGFLIPILYVFFSSRLSYHSLGLVFTTIEILQTSTESLGEWLGSIKYLTNSFYLAIVALGFTFIAIILLTFLSDKKKKF